MSTPYRLYYAPDNASLIIRLVLDELGQSFDTTLVDRRHGGNQTPDYLALNPNGLIPVLETPQGPIFETAAILLWLADRHGQMAPPPDAPERGAFLKWLFFTSNTLHAEMRLLFYPAKYVGDDRPAQDRLRAQIRRNLARHLGKLDALAASAPGWFAAPAPGVLDYYVAAALRWMALYPADGAGWLELDGLPHLARTVRDLEPRPAVQRAIAAEGLGDHPFSRPVYANPPEGYAT
ncbi:MAG: glutathione S-transferase family protein [Marinibacterium sp.]|nr:glutathione S-transferase family protein [Marinibacterium sp.]